VCLCAQAQAQTVDQIVSKAIAARGGAERIRALRSQRLTGAMTFATEPPAAFIVEIKRPGRIREELGSGANRIIRVTDGETGWIKIGNQESAALSVDDIRALSASADLEGPLLDHKLKGNSVEAFGEGKVGELDAFKLVVRMKDVSLRTVYIHTESYLELKWESTVIREGREFLVESHFSDYRNVNGLKCAFRIRSSTAGTPIRQSIVFDRIEVNPTLEEDRFTRP